MISVDTNVLVRLFVDDDPAQARTARVLFRTEQIFISKTVLLETAWVLRRRYGRDTPAIREAFAIILGLENIAVEDAPAVSRALELVMHGVELADAFHLASTPPGVAFVSFDRDFVRRAKRAGAPVASA